MITRRETRLGHLPLEPAGARGVHYRSKFRSVPYTCQIAYKQLGECILKGVDIIPKIAAHVLIVDDHRWFSDTIAFLLGKRLPERRRRPAWISQAATVAEGLRLASEGLPLDLAVVDLMLPDGDGLDVVRRIKALNPATRVVVLSAAKDLSGALDAGADEILSKDVPLLRVLSVLERLAWTTNRETIGV